MNAFWRFAKRVTPASLRRWYRQAAQKQPPARPISVRVDTFGSYRVAYRHGTTDEKVIGHSFENDIFFPAVPEYQPRAGDTVIDVGAHIGTFSLLAATRAADVRVFAIEASRESFDLLQINVALNRSGSIDVTRAALADREGEVSLYHSPDNWGHSTVSRLSAVQETVPAVSLARFLREKGIAQCAFMKMNCEGSEFPILLAADRSVLSRIQTLLVLYHCDLYQGADEQALLRHLEGCGFRTRIAKRREKRGWIIATRSEPAELAAPTDHAATE